LRHNGGLRNTSPAFLPELNQISLKNTLLDYENPDLLAGDE
jgi:hypothetical protein